jgi:membrane protein/epoxyqueuosine reductase
LTTSAVLFRLKQNLEGFLPLFKYLILHTETHAFCGSLAFFALLAFYPFSFLMLTLARHAVRWVYAYAVVVDALIHYYPAGQNFLLRNLENSVRLYGRKMEIFSAAWLLLGAAGFFIPLESAFNRLWKFERDRPYWKNQIVGFLLTTVCFLLAVVFILLTALLNSGAQRIVGTGFIYGAFQYGTLRVAGLLFSIAAIFLFYKFLPNGRVRSSDVFPAAILAGAAAEVVRWVYLMVLPLLDLERIQGPYYVSISFTLLVYFEAFVLFGGAFLATDSKKFPWMGLIFRKKE